MRILRKEIFWEGKGNVLQKGNMEKKTKIIEREK